MSAYIPQQWTKGNKWNEASPRQPNFSIHIFPAYSFEGTLQTSIVIFIKLYLSFKPSLFFSNFLCLSIFLCHFYETFFVFQTWIEIFNNFSLSFKLPSLFSCNYLCLSNFLCHFYQTFFVFQTSMDISTNFIFLSNIHRHIYITSFGSLA